MNKYIKSFIGILFIAFIGGAVPVFGKITLTEVPTFSFTFLRFLLASLVLLPFYLKIRHPIGKNFWKIFGLSFLAMLNVLLFAFGVQYTAAGVAQAIYTVSPIMAAVFSYFMIKEGFNLKKITGVLLGFIGALIIVFLPLIEKGLATEVTLLGNILIVIATTCVTLFTVLSKPFQKTYHPIEITTFFSVVTVLIMLPFSLYELQTEPAWWREVSLAGLLGLLYIGFFGTAFYYLVIQYIVKNTTPTLASMVLYVQPFAAILWAYVFLSETVTAPFFIGILLALAGVWLTLTSKRGKPGGSL